MIESDLPEDQAQACARVRQQLSSLMDGDATPDGAAQLCRHWHRDTDARAQWHSYHLIGDVLRSQELSRHSHADAEFLRGVRERLAREPVVLAPAPLITRMNANPEPAQAVQGGQAQAGGTRRSRFHLRRWVAPVGMAAGVALVAGAVLVTRPGGSNAPALATVSRLDTARADTPAAREPIAPNRAQARADTELVRYLDAHQQFPGTQALGPAPGFMRSAAYEPMPSQ